MTDIRILIITEYTGRRFTGMMRPTSARFGNPLGYFNEGGDTSVIDRTINEVFVEDIVTLLEK